MAKASTDDPVSSYAPPVTAVPPTTATPTLAPTTIPSTPNTNTPEEFAAAVAGVSAPGPITAGSDLPGNPEGINVFANSPGPTSSTYRNSPMNPPGAQTTHRAGSHLARLANGQNMLSALSPEAFGQVRTAMQGVRQAIRTDIQAGNYGAIGEHVRSTLEGLRGSMTQARTQPVGNPANRTARLTARKAAVDAAGAAYAARTDVSAMNKTRVAAAVANRDARLGARIAGTPVPARTPLPGKTPGTTPLRDAFGSIRRRG